MGRTSLLLSGLLSLTACSSDTLSGADRTAEEWLVEMASVYEKGAISCDFSMEINVPGFGDDGIKLEGNMIALDQDHSRVKVKVGMVPPGMESSMEMEILTVTDGEMIWMEMNLPPEAGGAQVMKLSLTEAREFAEHSSTSALGNLGGGGGMVGAGNMDPFSQIQQLTRFIDFEVKEVNPDHVILEGEMSEDLLSQLGPALEGSEVDVSRMTLILDRKRGSPSAIFLGGEEDPFMSIQFSNYHFLEKPPTPESFAYEPEEGIFVMDLGPLLEMMTPDEFSEDESEF